MIHTDLFRGMRASSGLSRQPISQYPSTTRIWQQGVKLHEKLDIMNQFVGSALIDKRWAKQNRVL